MSNLIVRPSGSVALPDKGCWTNRFEIRSESSNRVYVVAQNKETGKWGCSCPGYCSKRKCKHLINGCGLSEDEIHGNNRLTYTKRERLS
jgi:hypothetical protein